MEEHLGRIFEKRPEIKPFGLVINGKGVLARRTYLCGNHPNKAKHFR